MVVVAFSPTWLWVKNTGYLKSPGKRKNRLKLVVPKGWHFVDP